VHGNGLLDDEAILDKLADGLAGVGIADLGDLVGVQPDLVLAAVQDGRRKTLLSRQVDPKEQRTTTR
jgi:hypothetical protein